MADEDKQIRTLVDITAQFHEDQKKSQEQNFAREMIEKGKLAGSVKQEAKNREDLQNKLFKNMGKTLTSHMDIKGQTDLQEKMADIFANMDPGGIESGLIDLSKEVAHIPGAVKMLTEASLEAKKDQSKLDKLKAKEEKRDAFLKKFSFENNVKRVKEFAGSTFDKIKGLILTGALLALLTSIPKIMDSQAFKDILKYLTEGEFEKDISNAWNNYIKPAFGAIKASIVFLKNLFTGDFETAWKTFKEDWKSITIVLGIAFSGLIGVMTTAVSALASVVSAAVVALAPFTLIAAVALSIAALLGVLIYNIKDIGVENTIKWAGLLIMDALSVIGNLFLAIANAFNSVVDGIIGAGNSILKSLGFEGIKFRFGQNEMLSTNRAEEFRSAKSAEVNGIKDTIAALEANKESPANSAKLAAAQRALDESKNAFDFENSNGTSNRGNINVVNKGGDNNSTNVNTISNGNPPVTVMDDFGSIVSQIPTSG